MSEERGNALAIAELKGDRAAVRAEMEAMQSRIDAGFVQLREDMAKRDENIARRDKDNLRWQIGLWIATVVILGILVRWPA